MKEKKPNGFVYEICCLSGLLSLLIIPIVPSHILGWISLGIFLFTFLGLHGGERTFLEWMIGPAPKGGWINHLRPKRTPIQWLLDEGPDQK